MVHQSEIDDVHTYLVGLRARALALQISPLVFDRALKGVKPLPEVLDAQKAQAEFSLSSRAYMGRVIPASRIRNGRLSYKKQRALLNRIEAEFGVEVEVVTAIWGIESDFGRQLGNYPVIAALTTLGWKGRRADFFEDELIAILTIAGQGQINVTDVCGSWAGAMGHGQFMPSSYLSHAVDYDADGRADIWHEDPADGLASIANYLVTHGWQQGAPWGVKATLPEGFDYAQTGLGNSRKLAEWLALGVVQSDGNTPADYGPASVLLPVGASGPAFLTFNNFGVLLRYNNAIFYALAVALLSEQIAGAKPPKIIWPDEKPLTRAEMTEFQILLGVSGYEAGAIDGLIGPDTTRAIRAYQMEAGLPADGFPDPAQFKALQARIN